MLSSALYSLSKAYSAVFRWKPFRLASTHSPDIQPYARKSLSSASYSPKRLPHRLEIVSDELLSLLCLAQVL